MQAIRGYVGTAQSLFFTTAAASQKSGSIQRTRDTPLGTRRWNLRCRIQVQDNVRSKNDKLPLVTGENFQSAPSTDLGQGHWSLHVILSMVACIVGQFIYQITIPCCGLLMLRRYLLTRVVVCNRAVGAVLGRWSPGLSRSFHMRFLDCGTDKTF
jgi:hypothetical protein